MAASKAGVGGWLGLVTLVWALHPLLFSRERGVLLLMALTALLALAGWLLELPFLVAWSGSLGLVNLTLALALAGQPPRVWVGLSAGLALLALLDGSQRFAYVRRCRIEPRALAAWVGVFVRLGGLSLLAGLALTLLVVQLAGPSPLATAAGPLTIAAAGAFVGVVALFLLYTGRWWDGS
jgi:hypothetical protein